MRCALYLCVVVLLLAAVPPAERSRAQSQPAATLTPRSFLPLVGRR